MNEPHFYLYSRSNRNDEQSQLQINESTLFNSTFNRTLRTYLIIHGMSDNAVKPWVLNIKNNLLATEDANVIAVDWKDKARLFFNGWPYITAAKNTAQIGDSIAEFLSTTNIQLENVHCIGNSLGAHICGYVGFHGKLARITGLDPARPLFHRRTSTRLNRHHAHFVDIIHTSSLGLQESIGHHDYWPNGGSFQAGCFIDIECHHMRASKLYAESILSPHKFKVDNSNNTMGHYARLDMEQRQDGENFYLKTNSHSPFSIN